jgi:uncharacterized membrane protein
LKFSTEANRLEAFSDGVLAVIITIMVLELRVPNGTDLHALAGALPSIARYALSFVYVGIYWNNHHHLLRASNGIDGRVMWANLNLLFWLSLVPWATEWSTQAPNDAVPASFYSLVMLLAGVAYGVLQSTLLRLDDQGPDFAAAVAGNFKGRLSMLLYLAAVGLAFLSPFISDALLVLVAIIWLVPDRRMEPVIEARRKAKD